MHPEAERGRRGKRSGRHRWQMALLGCHFGAPLQPTLHCPPPPPPALQAPMEKEALLASARKEG